MGQEQSTASDPQQDDPPLKADYYGLLGLEHSATEDEIKKAYRRKALELHPDRNYGNVENATRLFAQIQSAYEVLSDPQERAWYDSHRDVLLRGDGAGGVGADEYSYNIRMTGADEVLKFTMKFNGRLEFSDAPTGFYGGLQDFFRQLAKEEDIACQWEDLDPLDYPEFGSQEDDYEDVVRPFYAAWNGFATRKTYAWKDHYRLSEAPDRRIRRLMEKENKKIRDDAIQEYNDAVRSLVAFVRKRDPRVQNNQKSEAERQKALRDAAAAQAARSRAARQAKLEELGQAAIPAWAQSRNKDEHEGGFSSESEIEEHEYDCVVCDKTFKSEAQFHAHEKSKKHSKLLAQLKREMQMEGKVLDLQPKNAGPATTSGVEKDDDELSAENSLQPEFPTNGVDHPDQSSDEEEDKEERKTDNSPVTRNGKPRSDSASPDESDDPGDDYAPRSVVEERLAGNESDHIASQLDRVVLEDTPATSDTDASGQPKIGKAKQRRARKAAQQAGGGGETASSEFKCAVCRADFPSKTKLFNHIKDKDHAAPVSQMKGPVAKGGKGKKR